MRLHDHIPRGHFLHLPPHDGQASGARRVGVEVEFAGLSVTETAAIIAGAWGGQASPEGSRDLVIAGGRLGKVKVELDISLAKKWAEDMAARALGDLVPVEIITAPLRQDQLAECETLLQRLERKGALGTQAKLGYGFGVHLNPELPPSGPEAFIAIARAYGLLEHWLRQSAPLDHARRVLPFVNPWPDALIDALARQADWDMAAFAQTYAELAPARGFGLDLLPALEDACPQALAALPEDQLKGGRPTFHYRLPESRIGDAEWSLAYEWNRWVLVEQVATDPALLAALAEAWLQHRDRMIPLRTEFAQTVEDLLVREDILGRAQGKL